ncbi:GlxA family transcriptional regulator [Roseovarius sp. SCSIO 43702]|uniref:GlxA family transcriptional regulator n=1 Tax=Roseovarius sp. SCSIO 43702 TaxID=2823043 RepID=UPI001C738CC4|nr:GlxA family transcriptional regulator [Roseovarius sp. SCSIO 43702]QYX56289.1 GlxA family transcriptional regulator [Roseovarius sp. SCSIO 43702]
MIDRSFIPKGAASLSVAYDGPPRDYHFLLLPKLTLLAFTAAVEPLRIANQVSGKALYRWFLMTEDGQPVQCSCGVRITPDSALEDVPRQAAAFVCAGIEPATTVSSRAVAWISRQAAHGCEVGGICTGAFALARAGVIRGRRFTLHWENQPAFQEIFHDLTPTGHLYEADRGLLTCGGGSAATDMMLSLIERDHGKDLAQIVADMCLHARSGGQDVAQRSAYSAALGSRNPHLIAAIRMMQENIETPVDILEIADEVGISRRQLERLFRQHTSVSPVEYYIDLRVARAYALLNETNLGIGEIAAATGFSGTSQLAQRFRRRYGMSPGAYRRSWSVAPSK